MVIANTVSKILGAILKIPLAYILKEEGLAIYQTAFSVYIMLLSFITSGIPFALSKYISEELTKKHFGNIRYSVKISLIALSALGFIASLIMFFGAGFFSYALKDPLAKPAIRLISPAIFFVAAGAVYKSCYQGYSTMTPTAISQVLESAVKLVCGYSLALWFSSFSVKYASAAAIFAVTLGEIFATALLFFMFFPYRRLWRNTLPENSKKAIFNAIFSVAIPLTATSVISGCLSLLETSVIRFSLTNISFSPKSAYRLMNTYSAFTDVFDSVSDTLKLSYDGARWLFGAYSGYAMTVFNLPVGILSSFTVSVLPIVTGAIASGNRIKLANSLTSAFKTVLVLSVPCAVMLAFFSEPILHILFKNTASAKMLAFEAPLIVPLALTQLLFSVQYASGKIMEPFWLNTLCMALKIILSYFLISIPDINIFGVIIGSYAYDTLQFILIYISLFHSIRIQLLKICDLFKILFSGALMFLCAYLVYEPLIFMLHNKLYALVISGAAAACAYFLSIFLTGAIKKEEIASAAHS